MNCVIIFVSCMLAVGSAGYSGHGATSYAHQSIGSTYPAASHAHAAPITHGYAHGGQYGSEARLVDPVAIVAGAPLPGGDTYEVAAAKAAHLQAHAAAKNGHVGASSIAHGHSHASPVTHGHGYVRAAPVAHGYANEGYYGAENRVVDPVAIAAGAPLPVRDTHEVAAAKAAHFKAHAAAKGNAHASPLAHGNSYSSSVAHGYAQAAPVAHGYAHAAPVAHGYAHATPVTHGYAHGGQYGSEARLVDPVAIAAGAPLPGGDTHEVAAAKAAHLQAHAAAKNNHLGLY